MALAKKCDICGKFYESYNEEHNGDKPNGLMFLNIDDSGLYWKNAPLDCCPECMESIKNHVENLKHLKDKKLNNGNT